MTLLRRILCALGLHSFRQYDRQARYMGHNLFPAGAVTRCRWCGRVKQAIREVLAEPTIGEQAGRELREAANKMTRQEREQARERARQIIDKSRAHE